MTISSPLRDSNTATANIPASDILPLFPNLPSYVSSFTRGRSIDFTDSFLMELISSSAFVRLEKIGFLGAIDYVVSSPNGPQPHRRRHNRHEHSLGVAQLALSYCEHRQLNESDTRLLVASALLHDIGHAPLSHSLEPIFKSEFGFTHHRMGSDILYGRQPIGHRISKILSSYGIDTDELVSMIDGTHTGVHSFLFSSPINFDTLEGITRSHAFFSRGHSLDPFNLVSSLSTSSDFPVDILDSFWRLKDDVYTRFIHHPTKLIYDGLAQAYCANNIRRFTSLDFLKTEDNLRRDHPALFKLFDMRRVSEIDEDILNYRLDSPRRSFTIDTDVEVRTSADLSRRYLQHKHPTTTTISELLDH